jgi:lysophospholipase L1-like esterase
MSAAVFFWLPLAALLLLLAGAAVLAARRGGLEYLRRRIGLALGTSPPLHDEPNYSRRLSVLQAVPVRSGCVIMLGDSITEGCEWAEMLGRGDVLNRGIGGDTSAGVLRRLDDVLALKPAAVCLMIGINDLGNRTPVADVAGNCRSILDALLAAGVPRLVVQSVLPLRRVAANPYRAIVSDADIAALNSALRRLAADHGAAYLDLHTLLSRPDGLPAEYTNDGLHLTGAAYRVWAAQLAPFLP